MNFLEIHAPVSNSRLFYLLKVDQLEILPNPANTSKLFQVNQRNELRSSWIFLNIQVRLSLDFQEILTSFFLFASIQEEEQYNCLLKSKNIFLNVCHIYLSVQTIVIFIF